MKWEKKLIRKPAVQRVVGDALAGYIRFVGWTSRVRAEPADYKDRITGDAPLIIAMWHGQHFMIPIVRPRSVPFTVMISRHPEAEVNAIAATRLGIETIRASGAMSAREMRRKGGSLGFREALRTLESGRSLAMTADVPKGPAKVAGRGIVTIAKHSGRPIVPVAFATSRAIEFDTWDNASLNLPFCRAGLVVGEPIRVPVDAGDEDVEDFRAVVKDGLDRATLRAYELAGRHWAPGGAVVHG